MLGQRPARNPRGTGNSRPLAAWRELDPLGKAMPPIAALDAGLLELALPFPLQKGEQIMVPCLALYGPRGQKVTGHCQ